MTTMWTVIITNNSGGAYNIEDIGLDMSTGQSITISDQYTHDQITGSDSLRNAVIAGDIGVNDGSDDLTSVEGEKFLKNYNVYRLEEDYHSKVDLAADGSGLTPVHWNNITHAPAVGAVQWDDPVYARVTAIASGKPGSPSVDDICVDTDFDAFFHYDGTGWSSVRSAISGDRTINLANASEDIFEFSTGSWSDLGTPDGNDSIMLQNDGDGKEAQYVYNATATAWRKIADVDFASHFNGDPSKHDASEIDIENSYTNFSSAPSDLETIMGEVDSQMTTALDHNTLDEAYDQEGAGVGRVINADSGAVKLDTVSATTAPLELVPKAALPTTGLQDGQLSVIDGILCIYDSSKSLWLSVARYFIQFGRKGDTQNQYLNLAGSNSASNNGGVRLARAAAIVSISGQLDASDTCTFQVRKNDVTAVIPGASLTITAAMGNSDTSLAIQLNSGDYLQAYLASTVKVEDPEMVIEIAWRL